MVLHINDVCFSFSNASRKPSTTILNYGATKSTSNLPGGKTGLDTHETKLPTYWNTPFNKICLGMKIGQQFKSVVINH